MCLGCTSTVREVCCYAVLYRNRLWWFPLALRRTTSLLGHGRGCDSSCKFVVMSWEIIVLALLHFAGQDLQELKGQRGSVRSPSHHALTSSKGHLEVITHHNCECFPYVSAWATKGTLVLMFYTVPILLATMLDAQELAQTPSRVPHAFSGGGVRTKGIFAQHCGPLITLKPS